MRLRIFAANYVACVCAVLIACASARADRLRNVEPGAPLPSFQRSGLDNESVTYDRNAGEVLLLVYLSAHQTQSERAMVSAQIVVAGIGDPALRLIFMTADADQLGYFRELRTQAGSTAPVALDAGHQIYGELGLIVFPTTVVSSKEGNLLHVLSGWARDYEYRLDAFCRHAVGQMDDAAMAERLRRSPQAKDEARARADRHRAAAVVMRSKGKLPEAIRELESALAIAPDNTAAVIDLVDVLVAQNKIDEAEAKLTALLSRYPDVRGAKLVQGLIHMKRGQYERAKRLLNEALLMNPDPVRVHYYLGQLYEQQGEHKQAMDHYRQALDRLMTGS